MANNTNNQVLLNNISEYARVLSALYGVCTIEIFIKIFNRDFPDCTISNAEEAVHLLKDVSLQSNEFHFRNNMIITNSIEQDARIPQIIASREKFKPYIPLKFEIAHKKSLILYDEDNQKFIALERYFTKGGETETSAKEKARKVLVCIQNEEHIQNALMRATAEKIIQFDTIDTANDFLKVFQELNNTSHLWINWGNIPDFLFDAREKVAAESVLSEKEIERSDKARNSTHIKLPGTIKVPTEKKCSSQRTFFDEYCNGNGTREPEWFSIGNANMKRITSSLRKIVSRYEQLAEFVPQLSDQWIANIWHKNANREGFWGSQTWDYHAFKPVEKIGKDLYTCIDSAGSYIVVNSPSVGKNFNDDTMTCLAVLVDAGGWYMTYGPVLGWLGITPPDILVLAENTASQMYKTQGLSAVIRFNPCTFWESLSLSQIPPVVHHGYFLVNCSAKGKFTENKIPAFSNKWICESQGIYTRWIYNKSEYLNSRAIYYNTKTGDVFLFSHNRDAFEKLLKQISGDITLVEDSITFVSMAMSTFLMKSTNYKSELMKFERIFGDSGK